MGHGENMAEFTKEELLEIIKIQQTTSAQLETLVGGINGIVERQHRILQNVENGLGERVVKALEGGCSSCRQNVKSMSTDVMWIKILLGLSGLVVMVVTVLLKITGH
jgi:hypothetical protein